MTTNAFLFGSRAYGSPREDSDIDVVLRMDRVEVDAILLAYQGDHDRAFKYIKNDTISLKFANLNLIICLTDSTFKFFKDYTAELVCKRPVTRDYACAFFAAKRGNP